MILWKWVARHSLLPIIQMLRTAPQYAILSQGQVHGPSTEVERPPSRQKKKKKKIKSYMSRLPTTTLALSRHGIQLVHQRTIRRSQDIFRRSRPPTARPMQLLLMHLIQRLADNLILRPIDWRHAHHVLWLGNLVSSLALSFFCCIRREIADDQAFLF